MGKVGRVPVFAFLAFYWHAFSCNAAESQRHRAGQPFELTVVNSEGKAVAAASVEIRSYPLPTAAHLTRGTFVGPRLDAIEATADEDGRITVALPERFTLSIKAPGLGLYKPRWKYGAPANFEAKLKPGWSIGGKVVDTEDRPIEGVAVRLLIEDPYDVFQKGVELKTDQAGDWRYDFVPDELNEVTVLFDHPHFAPAGWPLPRNHFDLEPNEIPLATIPLERGPIIEGIVTDRAGQPIAGALVRTKAGTALREATTDDDGHYHLDGLSRGITRIVVSAPGRALDLRELRVNSDINSVNFSLDPGHTIQVRVLDPNGTPARKAHIFFQLWRGPVGHFEFDHINSYTDDNGIWIWNEAPADELRADICPRNGMQLVEQSLVARDEEYVFRSTEQLIVSGSVVDAATGTPVEKFRAVMGGFRRPDYTRWDTQNASIGEEGEYHVFGYHPAPAHYVRIEADGYRTAVSRELETDEGNVTIDFQLNRIPPAQ